jgi:hypothetical protein
MLINRLGRRGSHCGKPNWTFTRLWFDAYILWKTLLFYGVAMVSIIGPLARHATETHTQTGT